MREAFDAFQFVLATVAIPNHFQRRRSVQICFRLGKFPITLGSPICLKSTSASNSDVLGVGQCRIGTAVWEDGCLTLGLTA